MIRSCIPSLLLRVFLVVQFMASSEYERFCNNMFVLLARNLEFKFILQRVWWPTHTARITQCLHAPLAERAFFWGVHTTFPLSTRCRFFLVMWFSFKCVSSDLVHFQPLPGPIVIVQAANSKEQNIWRIVQYSCVIFSVNSRARLI